MYIYIEYTEHLHIYIHSEIHEHTYDGCIDTGSHFGADITFISSKRTFSHVDINCEWQNYLLFLVGTNLSLVNGYPLDALLPTYINSAGCGATLLSR